MKNTIHQHRLPQRPQPTSFDDKLAGVRDLLQDTMGESPTLLGLDQFERYLPRLPPDEWAAHGIQMERTPGGRWRDGDIGGIGCGEPDRAMSFRLCSNTGQALARVEPDGLLGNMYTFLNPDNGLLYFADLNPVWETRRPEEADIRVADVPPELRIVGPLSDCEYDKIHQLRADP